MVWLGAANSNLGAYPVLRRFVLFGRPRVRASHELGHPNKAGQPHVPVKSQQSFELAVERRSPSDKTATVLLARAVTASTRCMPALARAVEGSRQRLLAAVPVLATGAKAGADGGADRSSRPPPTASCEAVSASQHGGATPAASPASLQC